MIANLVGALGALWELHILERYFGLPQGYCTDISYGSQILEVIVAYLVPALKRSL